MYTLSAYVEIPDVKQSQLWFHPITGMKIGLNPELVLLTRCLSGDITAALHIDNEKMFSQSFICLFLEELIYRGFLVPQDSIGDEINWHQNRHPFKRQHQSFYQVPIALSDTLPEETDIVFFGVPYDDAATHPGCRYGPNLLRSQSMSFAFRGDDHKGIYSLRDNKMVLKDTRCFDVGDLNLETIEYSERLIKLKNTIKHLPSSAVPVMIGGDHSYSYSAVSAACERNKNRPVTLLQFDSHLDLQTWPSLKKEGVDQIRHSNFVTHLLNDNTSLDVIQVGIREFQSLSENNDTVPDFPHERTSIFSDLSISLDADKVISKLGCDKNIYISLDVDCLREITRTGYPASVGITVDKLLFILHEVCSKNRVVGIDIMEFGANKSHDQHIREAELINYILLCCLQWIK